jgi:hypothetical protein
MKALTKGQYEVLAGVLERNKSSNDGEMLNWFKIVLEFADQFQESDPEFKRELFLKQCGVTE